MESMAAFWATQFEVMKNLNDETSPLNRFIMLYVMKQVGIRSIVLLFLRSWRAVNSMLDLDIHQVEDSMSFNFQEVA